MLENVFVPDSTSCKKWFTSLKDTPFGVFDRNTDNVDWKKC